jgi:tetratricopeptide (TPR) repeat protein
MTPAGNVAQGASDASAGLDAIAVQLAELGDWRGAAQVKAQSGTAALVSQRLGLFDQRYQEAFDLASAHGLTYLGLLLQLQKAQFQLSSVLAGGIVDSVAADARENKSELIQQIIRDTGEAITTCDAVDLLLGSPDDQQSALGAAVDAAAKTAESFELPVTVGLFSDWRSEKGKPPLGAEAIAELRGLSARLRAELEERRISLTAQATVIRAQLKSYLGDVFTPVEILARVAEKAANLPSCLVQVCMALADAYCARSAFSKINSPEAAESDLELAEQAAAKGVETAKLLANETEKLAPMAKLLEVRAMRGEGESSSEVGKASGFYGDMAIGQRAIRALAEDRPAEALALLKSLSGDPSSAGDNSVAGSLALSVRAAAYYDLGRYEDALAELDCRINVLEKQGEVDGGEYSFALNHRLEELQNLYLNKACALTKLNRLDEAWKASERGRTAGFGGVAARDSAVEWDVWRAWLRTERAAFVSFGLSHWGALIISAGPDDDQPSATLLSSFRYAEMATHLLKGFEEGRQTETMENSTHWTKIIFDQVPDLSAKLINPIEALLEGLAARAEVLYILPDCYLFRVPFAALTLSGGRYLNDLCPLSMAPSAEFVLANSGRVRKGGRSCLAVGVGQAPDDKPEVRFADQATEVAALWAGSGTCTTLLDSDATRDALSHAVDDVDVLHLACHGDTDPEVHDPMNASRLKLANGIVTAREALAWKLRADLVFMNVCQGGRFRIEGRGNISGFIRAFHSAGATSVIASVTHIGPLPAGELAVRFYRHWFTGVSKARALQSARQEVRKLYPDASDWASHALTGDYR